MKSNPKKISRICWNTEKWVKPSGRKGKSSNKNSYEFKTGYGHEEWLLDIEKIIDGYHYAFLQPINNNWKKYLGERFDISLYSINDKTRQKWWVGEIINVEIIDFDLSKKIAKKYRELGWAKEMNDQVLDAIPGAKALNPEFNFNIRFKIEDTAGILSEPQLISDDDKAISAYYYSTLLNKKTNPSIKINSEIFIPGHNPQSSKYTALYSEGEKTIDKFHTKVHDLSYDQLVKEFGENNVSTEHKLSYGASVDIAVKENDKQLSFYEIKTNQIVRICIREAIAQLLEYNHYAESRNIKKLTIISQNKLYHKEQEYLKRIRDRYNIPIYYRRADMSRSVLDKEE